jgi:UDP-N-acetylmuramoyl-L-alanyl-D-glutamate--2,6-diaminopimelate ligase
MVATGKVDQTAMQSVKNFTGLASDSREVRPGYLFAALPGSKADGGQFVKDAVARGAIAIMGRETVAPAARALNVTFIARENPRRALAEYAAAFYGAQPEVVAAVTGTNGKTSVAVFLREIWTTLGKRSASMGTIGVVTPDREIALRHTTPDPIETHRLLAELKREGIDHLALEASSHGLDQYRLHGVDVAAAGFTNITRDHLDYHPTFESYLDAKLRLFTEVVRKDGAAVINADAEHADRFIRAAKGRGLTLLTVGEAGETLTLLARQAHGDGQMLAVSHSGRTHEIALPLAGFFQASNALVAAGLAIALGEKPQSVFRALETLEGAPGRLEKVGYSGSGAAIYVDYAHTPDALETVLSAIRPHVAGRLHVIIGCGGDRDKGKRPLMGAAATKFADAVIVTDDNPRSEDPATIRKEALAGAPGAHEIADRAEAIRAGVVGLKRGDVLVIAGKGHELGQIIGDRTIPFSDREEAVKAALASGGRAGGVA